MQTLLQRRWKIWLYRHRRRMGKKQLQKRAAILENGIQLYVLVVAACPTRISIAQQQLVRLQLRIRLPNHTYLRTVSLTFLPHQYLQLQGQYLRIRFLPGDLSHVVVVV